MLFLPPQTTKLCAHWWCHSKKNLATCYSKQVLVPVYCSKKPNPFNIFLFFSPLFFFPFSSSLSVSPVTPIRSPLSLIPLYSASPTFVDPSPKLPLPPISLLSLLWLGFFVFSYGFGGCGGGGVGGG